MTSSPVGRMDKAQRRRLMAALVADAISAGKLEPGAVDFSALLFGDPDLWTDFGRHGAMVEEVIVTLPAATSPTSDRLVGKALPTAMKAVEDDIVRSLGIEAAQDGRGGGKSGDDTEYRRIRSRRKNYVQYLAERGDYERFNRSLQADYAKLGAASLPVSDLAKEFSLPLADVELCRDEVDALIAVWAAPPDADLRRFVPTKKGGPRRGLVLVDTAGRPKWGKRKSGGVASPTSESLAAALKVRSKPSLAEPAAVAPTMAVFQAVDLNLRDAALLRARVGLVLDDVHQAALPRGWAREALTISRITELLPYPRICHLDTALSAFGHPSQMDCVKAAPALADALENQATPWRIDLLKKANESNPDRLIESGDIADRWWRALTFYRQGRHLSGEAVLGPLWPDPWEYLTSARSDVYTEAGCLAVLRLDAIMEVISKLFHNPKERWGAALAEMNRRGGQYVSTVKGAQQPEASDNPARYLISDWARSWHATPLGELLPGFVD